MTEQQLARFNAAAKMIELDAEEAFHTCCDRFGFDVAGMLLVAFLRRSYGSMDSYPSSDDVLDKVRTHLREAGILDEI
ncbi:MAG: hypothetical protein ACXADB_06130 [Candidatus Hermodarchaeia archaeon]|jgi:hypothetical protein